MSFRRQDETLYSVNPRTGDTIGSFGSTQPEEIPQLIEAVRVAFKHWSRASLKTRLAFGKKAYRQFYRDRDEIAETISSETGKPIVEAYSSEILPVLDCFKYYLRNIARIIRDVPIRSANPLFKLRKGFVKYEPLGTIAVISPWNFPFLIPMQHIIPALLVGNAVIHKPSEHTTLTGLKIGEIFDRAYLPKGVLEIVTGLADVGEVLVHARVDKIVFTGSTKVGQRIYEAAAANLVPVNMELGGSDAMIVLEDANLERAANGAIWGAFSNAGQACLSVERLLVSQDILRPFLEKLTAKAARLGLGGDLNGIDVSGLANEAQHKKITELVADAMEKGAVLKFEGRQRDRQNNWFYPPTVLMNTNSNMKISRSELFGPVMILTPFDTEDDAVSLANGSEFGLGASVWTQDRQRGLRLAERIQAGSVMINDLQLHIAQAEAPYFGVKKSGIGVSHGPWGVMELVRPKYLNTDRPAVAALIKRVFKPLADNDLWWFKYNGKLIDNFKVFLIFLHGGSFWTKLKTVPAVVKAVLRKDYL